MFAPRFFLIKILVLLLVIGSGIVIYFARPSADTTGVACSIIDPTPVLNSFPYGQFDKDGLGTLRLDDDESLKVYSVGDQAKIKFTLADSEPVWHLLPGTQLSFGDAQLAGGYGEVKIEHNLSGYADVVDWSPKNLPGVTVTNRPWEIIWKVDNPIAFAGDGTPTGFMRGGNRADDEARGPFTVTVKLKKSSEQVGANGIGKGFQWFPIKASAAGSGFQNFLLIRDPIPYTISIAGPSSYSGTDLFDVTTTISRWTVVEDLTVENGTLPNGKPLYFYPNPLYPPRVMKIKPDGSGKEVVVKLKGKSWCGDTQARLVIPPGGTGYQEVPGEVSSSLTLTASPSVTQSASPLSVATESSMPAVIPSATTTTPSPSQAPSTPASASPTVNPQASITPVETTPSPVPTTTSSETPELAQSSVVTETSAPPTQAPETPTASAGQTVVTVTSPSATASTTPAETPKASSASPSVTPIEQTAPSSPSATPAATTTTSSQPAPTVTLTASAAPSVPVTVVQGQELAVAASFTGAAAPGELVTIYVYSDPKVYQVTADSNGHWSLAIPTADLATGEHRIEVETASKPKAELMKFTVTEAKEALAPLAAEGVATPSSQADRLTATGAVPPSELLASMPLWMWILGGLIVALLLFMFLHSRRLAAHNLHEQDDSFSKL